MRRSREELKEFLVEHGVDVSPRGLEEALALHGWEIAIEADTHDGCVVHAVPANRHLVDEIVGFGDAPGDTRLAVMRVLEQVIDQGEPTV